MTSRRSAHGTGAFHLSTLFEWSFVVTHQEDPILRRMTAILFSRKQIRQAMDRLPLTAADDELLHGAAPWYREWISRRLGRPALEERQLHAGPGAGEDPGTTPRRLARRLPPPDHRGVRTARRSGCRRRASPWVHGHTPREAPRAARSSSPRPSSGWARIWPDRARLASRAGQRVRERTGRRMAGASGVAACDD